ncbi:hypothetical protein ACFVWL_06445 [Microbacterium sp. NPDC058269]|uniref:hypothetical protein n=1 Tax=Microbacterium sp. NPDC058269 TaxID=3346414 RepID=UPI0036DF9B0D
MRVRAPSAKAGIVVGALIVLPMIGIVLAVMDVFVGYIWSLLAVIALVVFTARVFRGPGESLEPRPWWRMTTTALSSAVLSALFVIQAVTGLFRAGSTPFPLAVILGALLALAVAGAYALSATRLIRVERTRATS